MAVSANARGSGVAWICRREVAKPSTAAILTSRAGESELVLNFPNLILRDFMTGTSDETYEQLRHILEKQNAKKTSRPKLWRFMTC